MLVLALALALGAGAGACSGAGDGAGAGAGAVATTINKCEYHNAVTAAQRLTQKKLQLTLIEIQKWESVSCSSISIR